MAVSLPNLCMSCVHYTGQELGVLKLCTAFPEGIPPDVWNGSTSHWEPFDDGSDNGVVWEPRPDSEPIIVSYLDTWYAIEDQDRDTPAPEEPEPRPRGELGS